MFSIQNFIFKHKPYQFLQAAWLIGLRKMLTEWLRVCVLAWRC